MQQTFLCLAPKAFDDSLLYLFYLTLSILTLYPAAYLHTLFLLLLKQKH